MGRKEKKVCTKVLKMLTCTSLDMFLIYLPTTTRRNAIGGTTPAIVKKVSFVEVYNYGKKLRYLIILTESNCNKNKVNTVSMIHTIIVRPADVVITLLMPSDTFVVIT